MPKNIDTKQTALDIADRKCTREQREICVHGDFEREIFYVTPKKKIGENVGEYEHVKTFESEETDENYKKEKIEDCSNLETGMRVVLNSTDVQIITDISSRQIVTNVGNKFRKSDGVEWGGGDKKITHKLIKNDV